MAYFLNSLWRKLQFKFGPPITEAEIKELTADIAAYVVGFATDFPQYAKERGLELHNRDKAFKEEVLGFYAYLLTITFSEQPQWSGRLEELITEIKEYDSTPIELPHSFSGGGMSMSLTFKTTCGKALVQDRIVFYKAELKPTGPSIVMEALEVLKSLIAYTHCLPLRKIQFSRKQTNCNALHKELEQNQSHYYGRWPDQLRDQIIEEYVGMTVSPIMSQIDDLFVCLRTGRRPKA